MGKYVAFSPLPSLVLGAKEFEGIAVWHNILGRRIYNHFIGQMKKLIEKFKKYLQPTHRPFNSPFTFIESKEGIIEEISRSKTTGAVLGLYSPALGQGMFFTGVDDLYLMKNEEIVVLKPFDLHGVPLKRDHLSIREIKSVSPTSISFKGQ